MPAIKGVITLILTIWNLFVRCILLIFTTVWLDYFAHLPSIKNGTSSHDPPSLWSVASHNSTNAIRGISPYFVTISQWAFAAIMFGIVLVVMRVMKYLDIFHRSETTMSTRDFLSICVPMALSSLLVNFAKPGTRTAPYIQAVIGNFGVPIQFFTT